MPDVAEEKKIPTSIGKTTSVVLQGMNDAALNGNTEVQKEVTKEEGVEKTNGNAPLEITEDHLKEFFKSKNINFDGGLDAIKERLEYVPPTQTKELTAEEIAAKEIAKEKRILDLWIENGGKPEEFYNLKAVAQADVAQLSDSELRRELVAEGFTTKEEQDEVIQHRYFQEKLEEIEQGEDESTDDFEKRKAALEKKVKYGAKKLANRSTYIKEKADKVLKGLAKQIELQDKDAQDEVLLTQKVDEHFKSLPKETVIEMGDIEGLKVEPISHKVSETAVQKAMAILKSPQERNNFLFTEDGSINLPNLSKLLINSFEQEERDKRIYGEAITRNTQVFKQKFPYTNATALGIGGVIQKSEGKGKMAGYGKPERVAPTNT